MTGRFQDRVAIVTGGGSGIGRAAALAFAAEGARVVIADVSAGGGEETAALVRNNGGEAAFVRTDVALPADVAAMVGQATARYGRLDIAFNNAGVRSSQTLTADCTEEAWESVTSVDLKGVWLCMKEEILWMQQHGGGAIVNTASIAAYKGSPRMAEYVASKAGVVGLTKTAAVEYAAAGIRVNVVCPGIIATPLTMVPDETFSWEDVARKTVPLQRTGTAAEVAGAVLWLCSDEASYVTGVALPVDGGVLAQ
jgi:NAD(P)-dependent dehydrogenase (short-subunit alcohol dehydrogenase family)